MKAEWINPFLQAVVSTFDHLDIKWQRGAPSLGQSPLPLSGITGDAQGKVLISCSLDSALMLDNQFDSTFGMPPSEVFAEIERSALLNLPTLLEGIRPQAFRM